MGPPGQDGAPGGGRVLVDSLNIEVGNVANVAEGWVSRSVNGDLVVFWADAAGVYPVEVTFLHLTANCSADRHLPYVSGPGFAFRGWVFGSDVVYSRLVDPRGQVNLQALAMETISPGGDVNAPGQCVETPGMPLQPLGLAEIVNDPALGALRPPFRIR